MRSAGYGCLDCQEVAYVQGDLVDKLHGVAAKHNGYNPPIDLAAKGSQLGGSGLDGIVRLVNIPICLVEVIVIWTVLFVGIAVSWRTGGVATRGIASSSSNYL